MGEDYGYREIIEGLFGDGKLRLDAQAEYELRHEDYVMEMPQSGERIRGRANMRLMQEGYPNPPKGVLRRVTGSGDVWIIELVSDYGGGDVYHVVDIVEFREGRILKETRYYSKPFPAPEWRAEFVERL